MNEYFMKEAIKEAYKAIKQDEVPVGAVITKDEQIIAKAHNQKEIKKMVTKHAEIIAIEKANKKNDNWHLDDCKIYVTMEPCMMCSGAIIESHISEIIYGCKSDKYGITDIINKIENKNNYKIKITPYVLEAECKQILQEFFKQKRNKNHE